MGLDEAGRGSLVGPLVVGAFALRSYSEAEGASLRELGVRDSKVLTPVSRRRLYRRLRERGTLATAFAPPSRIDRYVSRNALNTLEVELMASLVVRLGARVVHVDACDPDALRFAHTLADCAEQQGPPVTVFAQHKADRDIPLVGAASIVAKVARDRAIEGLGRRAGLEIGSGYPSDPRTRDLVRRLLEEGRTPPWVRRSWKTFDTLKRGVGLRPLEAFA